MTKKNSKTAAVKKSNYDPIKSKARRDAKNARKAKVFSLEADRTDLLMEMATAAMNGEIDSASLVNLGTITREKVEEIDAQIAALQALSSGSTVRGFSETDLVYFATFDSEDGEARVEINKASSEDGGLFHWFVSYKNYKHDETVSFGGAPKTLACAIQVARSTYNSIKKFVK